MSSEIVIEVRGMGKIYPIYDKPHHRLMQMILGGNKRWYREFEALRDINFTIQRGETVGIVGRNGSGKSTLLQIICGTLAPSTGDVRVRGRVAALLELGAGFNPEFTGRENVYLNGSVLGLTRSEIDKRFDEIAAFADIGEFIEQPVKSYSSGMAMRLAFSVMAHVDADILIIDEALAVGDAFFTQKCMRYLREFKTRGTLLFVSHDSSAVTGLCERAVWLDHGRQQACGTAKEVVHAYLEAFMAERQGGALRRESVGAGKRAKLRRKDCRQELIDRSLLRNDIEISTFHPDAESFGELKARVVDVAILDEHDKQMRWVTGGESVVLELTAEANEPLENVIVGFYVKDRLGQFLFGDNTYLSYLDTGFSVAAGETFRARFHFDMPRLQAGDYFVTAGVADGSQSDHVIQSWVHEALIFKSQGTQAPAGIIGLPMYSITLDRE
ncbi:ABC transporter ATP-binding protein [Frateuria terrea]|uniref:Lipopolysaccharide transport system ATP-binding protein n=1 Tax=Frateuria terrea TaxID=529704 RepID=A0A1H6VMK3_9GAMM|nr:ABC transporter ATP-binding protein [Frateuria terrea]SEJ05888.1 lipopolysaccharide transport system ATP-binding protein [Frateuria terrea]SFP70761.1 lipopolysaccharide transport system ATP-binding protein [Frateuria terrea]